MLTRKNYILFSSSDIFELLSSEKLLLEELVVFISLILIELSEHISSDLLSFLRQYHQ
jgi:hypothetical protein